MLVHGLMQGCYFGADCLFLERSLNEFDRSLLEPEKYVDPIVRPHWRNGLASMEHIFLTFICMGNLILAIWQYRTLRFTEHISCRLSNFAACLANGKRSWQDVLLDRINYRQTGRHQGWETYNAQAIWDGHAGCILLEQHHHYLYEQLGRCWLHSIGGRYLVSVHRDIWYQYTISMYRSINGGEERDGVEASCERGARRKKGESREVDSLGWPSHGGCRSSILIGEGGRQCQATACASFCYLWVVPSDETNRQITTWWWKLLVRAQTARQGENERHSFWRLLHTYIHMLIIMHGWLRT